MATKKVTVTIPEHEEVLAKREAAARGLTLSAYVARAVRRAMAQDAMAELRSTSYKPDAEWADLAAASLDREAP